MFARSSAFGILVFAIASSGTAHAHGTIDFSDAADAQLITSDVNFDASVCPAGSNNLVPKPLNPLSVRLLGLTAKILRID
jgi:hypothetical protein